MATYVLVHGSRHGGWCWKRVAKLLRQRGHDVYAPTLSGNGERNHVPAARPINLDTHVEDVRAVLFYEDLHDVILVGHSYAGIVVTGVAEVSSDRIAQLVYLDAIMPVAGQSHLACARDEVAARLRSEFIEDEFGRKLPAAGANASYFGITDPDDGAWLQARLTDQPAETYEQPLHSDAASLRLPRVFMRCTEAQMGNPEALERIRSDASIAFVELAAAHDVMITAPELLADALLALAETQAARQPQ
jgi:pimeloyl-ACP methyl ester carboxylesterase